MKYKIWDKKTNVITPSGKIFTPEEWIAQHPAAGVLKTVCSGGELNGSFFGVYSDMVEMYRKDGCDFTGAETDEEKLEAIEKFEDERNNMEPMPDANERIAAALEYQVMASLPDQEV